MNSQLRKNTVVNWKEVPYPNLISAVASIAQGYEQFYSDLVVANEAIINHFENCDDCNKHEYCPDMKEIALEINRRFSEFKAFFKTMNSLERMLSWTTIKPGCLS